VKWVARRVGASVVGLILPVGIIVVWYVLTNNSTDPFWPPLSSIFDTFRQQWLFQEVPTDLVPSLYRLAVGFALGGAGGILLGVGLGMSPKARVALVPVLDFFRALPAVALIPAAFFIFGIGDWSKIAIVAWSSFWPVLLNTTDGVRSLDPVLRDMTAVYKLSRIDRIRFVVLPAASPQIFAGLRVAVAFSLLGLVVTEMFISTSGLGYYIGLAQTHYDLRAMWSGVFVIMLVAYCMNAGFLRVESRVLAWHRGAKASALGLPVAPRRSMRLGVLRRTGQGAFSNRAR
jgi:ABC-type nitrate/sulfonate/bicarbonate transport system permease component